MSEMIHTTEARILSTTVLAAPVPQAQVNLTFRLATMEDAPFMDEMIKKYHNELGFFPHAQMEGYIKNGWILIAEERREGIDVRREGDSAALTPHAYPLTPVGFIASRDRYFKRDEVGIVYLLCVKPGVQRKFVGAALLREVFNRSSYGCRMYCCWCAQDIAANRFWESMGFVPIAFRNGAEKKGPKGPDGKRTQRVHIFWQKRIRDNDTTTPWWFPSKTEGGAMRADRLAFPIPPGVHWSDVKPMQVVDSQESIVDGGEKSCLSTIDNRLSTESNAARLSTPRKRTPVKPTPVPERSLPNLGAGGLRFVIPKPVTTETAKPAKRPKPKAAKANPKLVAAARELRDRYLEQVNEHGYRLEAKGKYELTRNQLGVESRELREKNGLPLSTLNPQLSTSAHLLDAA